jgi:hypothetical protein
MLLTILMWSLLAAMLMMALAPRSRIGRAIRRTIVEAPARFLLDMTWAKAGRMALLAPVFVLLMLAGPEMIALMAMLGGDLTAVELLLAVWAAAVSGGLKAAIRRTAASVSRLWRSMVRLARPRARRRTPRRRRIARPRKPRNDGDAPVWAFA